MNVYNLRTRQQNQSPSTHQQEEDAQIDKMHEELLFQDEDRCTQRTTKQKGKSTKAWWMVESLNMKGRGSQTAERSKWSDINLMMKERRSVQTLFSKQLSIHYSACEENPTGKSGVAIVLNKDLVKTEEAEMMELIPGRALLLQAPWHAAHEDNRGTREAFQIFKHKLQLRDGWRETNTEKRDFTFMQMSGNFS
ncbi:hypothetical protein EDD18DRAFT_1110007 [Armillaria luteobubalina]|uniref:Uncharacterized protein n=1 Tax=Armillaria luteobubalina TaxID=153913 RepID=A0AA39PUZ1_9AGAR|nr:hypothetical protein EDD18DRAFT_1110007 [Armillaria luteobubalina]